MARKSRKQPLKTAVYDVQSIVGYNRLFCRKNQLAHCCYKLHWGAFLNYILCVNCF